LWIGQSYASYHFDEKQKVARFFPPKKTWTKKLNSVEYFFSYIYPSGGLCFKGAISVERFLAAMHNSLQAFDFMFGRFHMNEEGLGIRYPENDERNSSFIQLEIEESADPLCSATLPGILPVKIDGTMRNTFVDPLEALQGMGIGAFKLTIFNDGFAIGYYLNHAFFDQSSIVYFLLYLSHIYTHGDNNNHFKKPVLMDYSSQTAKDAPIFKDLTHIRQYGEAALGWRYQSGKSNTSKTQSPSPALQKIDVRFRMPVINKLIQSSKQFISPNDIIHALLLKMYSFNYDIEPDETFCLTFSCNMRKRCGLGANTIGNVLNPTRMYVKKEFITNATIVELAHLSREYVFGINVENFRNNIVWYNQIQGYNETPLHYRLPASDQLKLRVTNWSTFNYNHILFDDARIVSLKTPSYASTGLSIISFDSISGEKVLTTSLYVPHNSLESIMELARSTNLFTVKPEETKH
jgi:hypothetical protein